MNLSRCVGFDSKRITRTFTERIDNVDILRTFQACLGAGITVENVETFSENYDQVMDDIFTEYGMNKKSEIYNSYELKRIFIARGGQDILEIVFSSLAKHINFVDIFYSYFLASESTGTTGDKKYSLVKPLGISVFYGDQNKKKIVTGTDFLDILEPSYAMMCAWSYINSYPTMPENTKILSDAGSMKPCVAWTELSGCNSFYIVPKGDRCNKIISCADIIAALIDERVGRSKQKLNKEMIDLLPEIGNKAETHFIGEKYLRAIKPSHDLNVDLSAKLARPVFVLFSPTKGLFGRHDKKLFESSNIVSDAYSAAARKMGSVKFFDPTGDSDILTEKDYLVYYDEDSEKQVKHLKNIGIRSQTIKATDLNQC